MVCILKIHLTLDIIQLQGTHKQFERIGKGYEKI